MDTIGHRHTVLKIFSWQLKIILRDISDFLDILQEESSFLSKSLK